VWDAEKLEQIGDSLGGHSGSVNCVAFSPDGKRVISGAKNQTIQVWDVEKLEQIGDPLSSHSTFIRSVSFSSSHK
jgi:WD40 repeat protein